MSTLCLLDADTQTCQIRHFEFGSRHHHRQQSVRYCRCESTYLERVDDVRDEMISNIGNFGSRLLLIVQKTTKQQMQENCIRYHNYSVFRDSHFSTIVECLHHILCNII